MAPTIYACVHESHRLSVDEFDHIVEANHLQQINDFCPAWGLPSTAVIAAPLNPLPGVGTVLCYLRDSQALDPPDALAYHDVETGVPTIHVIIDKILSSPYATIDDISCALGHELCETDCDPTADKWSNRGDGTEEPEECVDRVQGLSYPKSVQLSGGFLLQVRVTDFLLPAAFSDGGILGVKYDHLGVLKHPRDIVPGGYAITRPIGGSTEATVFGSQRNALAYSHAALKRHGVI